MMKRKVRTKANLTLEQQKELQRLGCNKKPYIIYEDEIVYGTECSEEQENMLCQLPYVVKVEDMPVVTF